MNNQKEINETIHRIASSAATITKNYSFNTDALKQHQKALNNITTSLVTSEQTVRLIRGSCVALTEAIKAINPTIQLAGEISKKYSELFDNLHFTIPIITIPKFELPPELLDSFKRLSYLSLYHRANWPLFFIDSKELRQLMDPFLKDETPNPTLFKETVIDYFDRVGIETVTNKWDNVSCVGKERLSILREAISLYSEGHYYGCTAILMCQIAGVISSSFYKLHDEGIEFDVEAVRLMYESYNPNKKWSKGTEAKIVAGEKRIAEKELLLCLLAEVDSGVLYWKAATDYLYNIVFTSDDDKYEHACRNKICHGIQLNYGDNEHALKAILSVDLAIQIAEIMQSAES